MHAQERKDLMAKTVGCAATFLHITTTAYQAALKVFDETEVRPNLACMHVLYAGPMHQFCCPYGATLAVTTATYIIQGILYIYIYIHICTV